MNTASMSQGGRVVVPKALRQELGVKDGDEVIWTEADGQIVLTSRKAQLDRARIRRCVVCRLSGWFLGRRTA